MDRNPDRNMQNASRQGPFYPWMQARRGRRSNSVQSSGAGAWHGSRIGGSETVRRTASCTCWQKVKGGRRSMRRKKLARLLRKLRAMRRSCPQRDQLLMRVESRQNGCGAGFQPVRENQPAQAKIKKVTRKKADSRFSSTKSEIERSPRCVAAGHLSFCAPTLWRLTW